MMINKALGTGLVLALLIYIIVSILLKFIFSIINLRWIY